MVPAQAGRHSDADAGCRGAAQNGHSTDEVDSLGDGQALTDQLYGMPP
jgi:hypothetical protein